jgi:hypothetical protein
MANSGDEGLTPSSKGKILFVVALEKLDGLISTSGGDEWADQGYKNFGKARRQYRLVNKSTRELLVLYFSKCFVLLDCVSVNVASVALIDILSGALAEPQSPFPVLVQESTSEL